MLLELSLLPIEVQQHIRNNGIIQIVENGKIVKEAQFNEPKSYAKGDFDYDLERMKYMMDTEFYDMPKFNSDEEFLAWVNS